MLDIKVSSGNTKINQLKELSFYCKYHKKGNKFIIDEVYKQPTIKLSDILKPSNSKYIKLLADILLIQLYKKPNDLQQVPLIKLFTMLGITNDNYKYANNYRKELSQLYDIQLASIYYFYSNTRTEFKKIIERCLNNLQKRSVLFWSKCIMIVEECIDEVDGSKYKRIYKADKETTQLIIDTQKEALQHLYLNNMYELMKDKKKLKEFNSIVQKELSFNYFYAYDITIGQKAIQIEYNNIQKEKKSLNKLMIDKSNQIFNKDFYKRYKNDYELLTDILIDCDYEKDLKDILIEKYTENFNYYLAESIELDKKYNKNQDILKDKYLDTYRE